MNKASYVTWMRDFSEVFQIALLYIGCHHILDLDFINLASFATIKLDILPSFNFSLPHS
jgi:hypothetical protein